MTTGRINQVAIPFQSTAPLHLFLPSFGSMLQVVTQQQHHHTVDLVAPNPLRMMISLPSPFRLCDETSVATRASPKDDTATYPKDNSLEPRLRMVVSTETTKSLVSRRLS